MLYFDGQDGQQCMVPLVAKVLRESGFVEISVIPTGGYYSLVNGYKR
jgi:hypothetical protein